MAFSARGATGVPSGGARRTRKERRTKTQVTSWRARPSLLFGREVHDRAPRRDGRARDLRLPALAVPDSGNARRAPRGNWRDAAVAAREATASPRMEAPPGSPRRPAEKGRAELAGARRARRRPWRSPPPGMPLPRRRRPATARTARSPAPRAPARAAAARRARTGAAGARIPPRVDRGRGAARAPRFRLRTRFPARASRSLPRAPRAQAGEPSGRGDRRSSWRPRAAPPSCPGGGESRKAQRGPPVARPKTGLARRLRPGRKLRQTCGVDLPHRRGGLSAAKVLPSVGLIKIMSRGHNYLCLPLNAPGS